MQRFNKVDYDGTLKIGDIIFDVYGNPYTIKDVDDRYYYAD